MSETVHVEIEDVEHAKHMLRIAKQFSKSCDPKQRERAKLYEAAAKAYLKQHKEAEPGLTRQP